MHECNKCKISKQQKQKLSLDKPIQFTDGCGSQFKSKNPFVDISLSKHEFQIETLLHYFGSRHGKEPCDAVGGVINCLTRRAIAVQGKIVNSAEDMFKLCFEAFTKDDHHKDVSL